MGKIRVKTLGDEALEKEQKKEAKKRQEAKKTQEVKAEEQTPAPSIETVEEKAVKTETKEEIKEEKPKKKEFVKTTDRTRSKNYQTVAKLVDKSKEYNLTDALSLLEKLKTAKFDETVELHINTTETGINGTLDLPHGTGKKVRVAIADEALISEIEKGKIDFDILLAVPQMMPRLAKVAKVLGPRGLMPNPKNGTITQNPQEVAKKFEGGQVRFKTETKSPIIHLSVGKLSFGEKKLSENINTVLKALPIGKVKNATLKSTMSPGIKIQLN